MSDAVLSDKLTRASELEAELAQLREERDACLRALAMEEHALADSSPRKRKRKLLHTSEKDQQLVTLLAEVVAETTKARAELDAFVQEPSISRQLHGLATRASDAVADVVETTPAQRRALVWALAAVIVTPLIPLLASLQLPASTKWVETTCTFMEDSEYPTKAFPKSQPKWSFDGSDQSGARCWIPNHKHGDGIGRTVAPVRPTLTLWERVPGWSLFATVMWATCAFSALVVAFQLRKPRADSDE